MQSGLLEDLKVVEYGNFISAPYCAKLLGDLGASVIKVENPEGDIARRAGPFPGDALDPEKSGLFLALNTSKRGVTLDLHTKGDHDLMLRLLSEADIFIENNPPESMAALGLGYESVSRRNPRLVFTSIAPFGATGPYRDYKATELVFFHMSGYAELLPDSVDDPNTDPPLRAGAHLGEFVAAVSAATATIMAIWTRTHTGKGTHVDLSAQEAIALMHDSLLSASESGPAARNRGEKRPPGALIAYLPTTDGLIVISPREDSQWKDWVGVMGNPEWASDPRFATRESRLKNFEALEKLLIQWTSPQKKEDIYRKAQGAHVPAFPISTAPDLLGSRQLLARGFFVELDHPLAGRLRYPGFPYSLSNSELRIGRPAPTLGQHSAEVFAELG